MSSGLCVRRHGATLVPFGSRVYLNFHLDRKHVPCRSRQHFADQGTEHVMDRPVVGKRTARRLPCSHIVRILHRQILPSLFSVAVAGFLCHNLRDHLLQFAFEVFRSAPS
ncbi:uncharacterized protein LAESUDRAFT_152671 [Laetiporus sulphureus 93-53]|uniref:Uncharacterized protein n=1 Tax=Laetiporus sulphureus 93-53 TaxID=1314785 RepID=A0A165HJ54_9APHY|nr:uncharacterized protein LAESUDRAFT_152671 [Laetiporus sulphureus 93-53]KZT11795.1 hypothetical protein LAESUDRAFT_152671 [Laetiporus sulphureus 93-53]